MKKVLFILCLIMATWLYGADGVLEVYSNVSGTSIYLNDVYKGVTKKIGNSNVFRIEDLTSGTKTVKCSHPGYYDSTKDVFIKDAGVTKHEVNLKQIEREKTLEEKTQDMANQLRQVCSISVTSKPSGAKIFLNGEDVGFADKNLSNVEPGFFHVKCSYGDDYLESRFSLDAGASVDLTADFFKNKMEEVKSHVITIGSQPPAKIFIDGKYIGEGTENILLTEGKHEIKLEKMSYKTITGSLDVRKNQLKTYILESNYAKLEITSNPSQAWVHLNDDFVGKTPFIDEMCQAGTYQLSISYPDYLDKKEKITIIKDVNVKKHYDLVENLGTLKILAPASEIYINNKYFGTDSISVSLPPNRYNIEARREKHKTASQPVHLVFGSNPDITLQPQEIRGIVNLTAKSTQTDEEIKDLSVYINDEPTDYKTPSKLDLLIGEYEIALKHPDYPDFQKKVQITPNKTQNFVYSTESYSWYNHKRRVWNVNKWMGIIATMGLAGASAYCEVLAKDNYESYKNESLSTEAQSYRERTNELEEMRDYLMYGASATGLYSFFSWVKSKVYASQLKK